MSFHKEGRGSLAQTGAAPERPPVVAKRESQKPVGIRPEGTFVSLAEYGKNPDTRLVCDLSYSDQARLAIARLKLEPKNQRLIVLGDHEYTIEELVAEIKSGSTLGREYVEAEQAWLEYLKRMVRNGEYLVSASSASERR
jgi:hypothetical protein